MSNRGGAREGAGAPKKAPHIKRVQVAFKFPSWFIDRLRETSLAEGESQADLLIEAVLKLRGWKPPSK